MASPGPKQRLWPASQKLNRPPYTHTPGWSQCHICQGRSEASWWLLGPSCGPDPPSKAMLWFQSGEKQSQCLSLSVNGGRQHQVQAFRDGDHYAPRARVRAGHCCFRSLPVYCSGICKSAQPWKQQDSLEQWFLTFLTL